MADDVLAGRVGTSILSPNETWSTNGTDVLCADCINNPNPIACVRSLVVAVLGLSTACACLARIVRLSTENSPSHLRLLLYCLLVLHCFAGSFEWLIGWTTQLSLFLSYTRAILLLVVCYFYLDVASRMMHWSSTAGKRLSFVALFLFFSYFTAFLVMGFILSIEPKLDCSAPFWIWFSAGECFIVQLMVGSFFLILRRMSRISAPNQLRINQRRDVFILFWSFETATLVELAYHISLFMLSDEDKGGCSAVFQHDQIRYTALKAPYDLVSFILPVWAVLYVFRARRKPQQDIESDESTNVSRSSSTSRAVLAEVVTVRNWRRRYRPLTQPAPHERPVLPSQYRQNRSVPINSPRLRSVSSAPQMRRVSVSQSIVSSPLYSIPEELQGSAPPMVVGSLDQLSTVPFAD